MALDVTTVTGGRLPDGTVEVLRVVFDQRTLLGASSANARKVDTQYEVTAGNPQYFTFDKDGLLNLRIIPAASGDADYDEPNGIHGAIVGTDDTGITFNTSATGGYGIPIPIEGGFPASGPYGTVARVHPETNNLKVEVARLNRPLTSYPFEI